MIGNQKTCDVEALARGADIVVMLHPDYGVLSTAIQYRLAALGLMRPRRFSEEGQRLEVRKHVHSIAP